MRKCLALVVLTVFTLLPATGDASTITFSNSSAISIPPLGNASPYPSQIVVSGMGPIEDLAVSLLGFSHTFPDDVGVLLVGPTGVGQVVFDGATTTPIADANLTFADGGALWPDSGTVLSGTYTPRSYYIGDVFPAPAPLITGVNETTVGEKSFSVFDGTDPNGVWSLYVVDFLNPDSGSISGGWSLTITDNGALIPEPTSFLLLGTGLAAGAFRRLRRRK